MEIESYIKELTAIKDQLSEHVETASISGEGLASFIVTGNNNYGIEIYRDENKKIIIDPALDGELLGERECEDFKGAIQKSLSWLREGKLN